MTNSNHYSTKKKEKKEKLEPDPFLLDTTSGTEKISSKHAVGIAVEEFMKLEAFVGEKSNRLDQLLNELKMHIDMMTLADGEALNSLEMSLEDACQTANDKLFAACSMMDALTQAVDSFLDK